MCYRCVGLERQCLLIESLFSSVDTHHASFRYSDGRTYNGHFVDSRVSYLLLHTCMSMRRFLEAISSHFVIDHIYPSYVISCLLVRECCQCFVSLQIKLMLTVCIYFLETRKRDHDLAQ